MKKLTINRQVEKKIHKGYKILEKSDFEQLPFDNEVVDLVTASGHFLGTGYLSEQNKGLGHFYQKNHLGSGLLWLLIC